MCNAGTRISLQCKYLTSGMYNQIKFEMQSNLLLMYERCRWKVWFSQYFIRVVFFINWVLPNWHIIPNVSICDTVESHMCRRMGQYVLIKSTIYCKVNPTINLTQFIISFPPIDEWITTKYYSGEGILSGTPRFEINLFSPMIFQTNIYHTSMKTCYRHHHFHQHITDVNIIID